MGGVNGINGTGTSGYNAGDATDDGLTTVKVGETSLSQVAQRLGMDVDRLKAANPQIQDPTHLQAGQNLHLPQTQPAIDPTKIASVPQLYPGQPALALPHFSLSMRKNEASLDVLDRIPFSLHPSVVPGTPLNGKIDEDNLSRDEVINPSLHIGKRIFAQGTLSLGLPYPKHSVDPTEVSVEFNSVPLSSIRPKIENGRVDLGQIGTLRMNALGVGGAKGDVRMFFDLKQINAALAPLKMTPENAKATIRELSDTLQKKISEVSKSGEASNGSTLGSVLDGVSALASDPSLRKSVQEILSRHVPPGTDPSVVAEAAKNLGKELSGPGFSVEGPVYFGVPIGYGYFKADTTRSTGPSSKASAIGAGVPATLMMVGPALIPAGVISEIASPAAGAIVARDGEASAISVTVAARPYLDTGVIGAAGVATASAGLRLRGFDLTAEGGWRGQKPIVGGTGATKHSLTGDYMSMQQARQDAQAGYNENVEKTEAGVFSSDLKPAEVLSDPRPASEFYFMLGASKRF